VTLIPPKGSPYSAANIQFRIVAAGDNQEKGSLADPLLQAYKGPVSITEDQCIVYVATFHGFEACDFATKPPPEVARVAHPVLVHSSGPHGAFFVDVTPAVPRVTYFYAQGFEPRPQAAATTTAQSGGAAAGTVESVATGAPRVGATPVPKWKILKPKDRRLRMLFEPTGAGACTAIVIGQMEGMADSAPATLVFQVGQASAVTISPTQNGLHFDLGPEPGTTVRFCYGVNKGGDATLTGLKLPRSPFGWTAVDAHSQVAEGGGVDVCFGGVLGELRELERIGNTLHVWAQAAAIGMIPSPIVQWKTNLRSHVRRVTIVPSQMLDDGTGNKSGMKTALNSIAESSSRLDARFSFDPRATSSEIDAALPAFLQFQ
jgi:hypothetical protein